MTCLITTPWPYLCLGTPQRHPRALKISPLYWQLSSSPPARPSAADCSPAGQGTCVRSSMGHCQIHNIPVRSVHTHVAVRAQRRVCHGPALDCISMSPCDIFYITQAMHCVQGMHQFSIQCAQKRLSQNPGRLQIGNQPG